MPLSHEQLVLLQSAFRPHAPIEDPAAFFGRVRERTSLREALSEPGLQVVVYGEPGCGKTSLSNVVTEGLPRIKVFCEEDADFARIVRDIALELQKLDPKRYVYDALRDTITVKGTILPLGKMTGNNLLAIFPSDEAFCVILDELDRVKDDKAIASIAELVKNVATNRPNLTFIMLGVADTAGALLKGHSSNFRNIRELQLDRMDIAGLHEILIHGQQLLGLQFSNDVSTEILQLCDGMPYYLHLLAKHAAKAALEVNAPTVELDDLKRGSVQAASEADQQLRTIYEYAIQAERGTRIYQRIVWGMANLNNKTNNVATIRTEANNIALSQADDAVTPQAISAALKRLASEEKRKIIFQPMAGVYGFTSPLMKGFIRLVRYRE
jgi:hypothetical protein